MSDTSRFPRSQAAIAGIGCTEFSKDSGMSTFGLAAQAVKAAVADAGLELSDVDGLATFGPGDSVPPNVLAQGLRRQRREVAVPVNRMLRSEDTHDVLLAVSAGVPLLDCMQM